jgi:Spy/CpxP family protein refolding chaperone
MGSFKELKKNHFRKLRRFLKGRCSPPENYERGEIMSSRVTRLILAASLLAGLSFSSAFADLGLQQILSEQGVVAVGKAVQQAVTDVYDSTDDEESIKSQITAIMNEAAATANGEAVRYAIVAVMAAGGPDNLDLSKEAIDNSAAFTDFPEVTAFTVAASESLLAQQAAEQASLNAESGGGGEPGGDGGESGGGDDELGGGDDENPFDDGDQADIKDEDSDATPT